jgi:hypothetical protein
MSGKSPIHERVGLTFKAGISLESFIDKQAFRGIPERSLISQYWFRVRASAVDLLGASCRATALAYIPESSSMRLRSL